MITNHFYGCGCAACCAPRDDSTSDSDTPTPPGGGNATKPVYSTAEVIDALRKSGGSQVTLARTEDVVGYSIGTGQLVQGQGNYSSEHSGYVAMTEGMERIAAEAFELWDEVIAIEMVEVANDPQADITFNYSSTSGGSTYAAHYAFGSAGDRGAIALRQTDLWFAHNWWTHDQESDLVHGGYGIFTYLHEIGHALGLSHPGPYNGSASYNANATHFQDTRGYTVMSYFNAGNNLSGTDHFGSNGLSYGATPLLHDILAAQSIYGADMTTRTGSTTYGFNATANRDAFDFTINVNPVVAIWDAGGVDKIDVSGWSTNQIVDLNQGAFSSVGDLTENVAIAYGVDIEMAAGGSGHDRLIGNALANVLTGNGGNDALEGGGGADILFGGMGADALDGGTGDDWARFSGSSSGVRVDLNGGQGAGGEAQGDTYVNIEHVSGSAHDDILTGDHLIANRLFGMGGDDQIFGGGGHDFLLGHGGNDQIFGGTGRDVIRGGEGADLLDGGTQDDWIQYNDAGSGVALSLLSGTGTVGDAAGDQFVSIENVRGSAYSDSIEGSSARNIILAGDSHDVIVGGGGNDVLYGEGGDDILIGGGDQDTFYGGAGADRIDGAGGSDWVRYNDAASGVAVSLLTGSGTAGEAAGDVLSNVELLWGSEFDDTLAGDNGANMIRGGAGNDTIIGHGGNDILQGYDGADLFVFSEGDGIDRINGFELGADRLQISGTVTSFGQLSVSTFRGDAAIAYDAGDVVILTGVAASDVLPGIFVFG